MTDTQTIWTYCPTCWVRTNHTWDGTHYICDECHTGSGPVAMPRCWQPCGDYEVEANK